MNLLVVGTVAFDDVETPCGRMEGVLGGSATYFSYAASFFTRVALVGAVGEDFPPAYLGVIDSAGIDRSGLEVVPGKKTFRWAGRYAGDMNAAETLATELNVLEGYRPAIPGRLRRAPFVFLANGEPALQLAVLEQLEGTRFLASDTMNLWIATAADRLKQVLGRVDAVILNDGEARMLTGRRSVAAAAEEIHSLGPGVVIVKRGEHGSFLSCRDGLFGLPAFPLKEVADPTGAGDSFAGGFMGSLAAAGSLDFGSLKRAAAYGTVVASFNVEDFSLARFQRLNRREIDERFEQLLAYVRL